MHSGSLMKPLERTEPVQNVGLPYENNHGTISEFTWLMREKNCASVTVPRLDLSNTLKRAY